MRKNLLDRRPIIMSFKVKSDSQIQLKCVVDMVLKSAHPLQFYKREKNTFMFYNNDYNYKNYNKDKEIVKLPFNLDESNAFDFIYNILKSVDESELEVDYPGDYFGFGFEAESGGNFGDPVLTITPLKFYYAK